VSLPVLKVTVNESFFIPCQNGFSSTLANLYTDFMRAQRTPNANFSIIDIMETFNNNQEEFQMFLAQVGTLLAQKSSNPLKFSNNVAGYVQYNKETQTLQKKYDALSEKIEHEEKKLYDIRMGGITG
jgi:superfamily II RNA helicase